MMKEFWREALLYNHAQYGIAVDPSIPTSDYGDPTVYGNAWNLQKDMIMRKANRSSQCSHANGPDEALEPCKKFFEEP